MMKALKMGLFGLALGALGAVAFPTQEAEAQTPNTVCCSLCNPRYQACLNSAGNNSSAISSCVRDRSYCESVCLRTC
ncbi:hypothetical protein [Cystobacter fuscus]|uniref:hypothetical protein n=1 Tax=Cystobacter fuscus TaxID=43 RepID=UPI002B281197|nr:hypothetical protein F0U63_18675 [Cystobacter fuscus]